MTDTQHTPGPWRVNDTIYRHSFHIVDGEGAFVADTDRCNARLIAAAPELLEVLGDVLPWLEKAEAEGVFENCAAPKGGQRAINRARAAIAKATGVQS